MTKRKTHFICISCGTPFQRPEKKRLNCSDACQFWANVEKTETCWNWISGGHYFGYGEFRIGRKLIRAHRYSYELHKGLVPDGKSVLHECDNPRCVNPDHLYAGTQTENSRDISVRNRVGGRKLSPVDIPVIRSMLAAGKSCERIGVAFGVTGTCIWFLKHGRTWRYA